MALLIAKNVAKNGGEGTQIFKADIQAAFKLIPVRPDQHAALGFYWENKFWYQVALPFGCRMSPKLFNEFATLLRDLVRKTSHNVAVLNYLDDFFGVEKAAPPATTTTYQNLIRLCERVGVPLAPNKCSPSSTRIEILGIIVDTTKMCYELPARKLQDILESIRGMIRKQKTTRRELLSLVGKLVHACRCLPPGRGFMRRLLDAAYSVSQPQHAVLGSLARQPKG